MQDEIIGENAAVMHGSAPATPQRAGQTLSLAARGSPVTRWPTLGWGPMPELPRPMVEAGIEDLEEPLFKVLM